MTNNEAVGYNNILGGASVAQVESKDDRFKIYDFLLEVANKHDEITKKVEGCRQTIKDEAELNEYVNNMLQEDAGIEEPKFSKKTYYEFIDSNRDKMQLAAVSALAKLME